MMDDKFNKSGVEIRVAANGYIVRDNANFSDGKMPMLSDTFVFESFEAMTGWLQGCLVDPEVFKRTQR